LIFSKKYNLIGFYMTFYNKKIEDLLADDSFLRWLDGDAAPEESEMWENWLHEDPANESTYREAKKLYRSLSFKEELPDTLGELNKLRSAVANYEMARHTSTSRPAYYRASIAVAIVLLLALTVFFQFGDWNRAAEEVISEPVFQEVNSRYGQLQQIRFPDGSSVMLNANSSLAYPESFSGEEIVFHIEGEAYFDIEPQEGSDEIRRRYSVRTPDGLVSVLGTRFNINTRNNSTEVVLEQGVVEVSAGEGTVHDESRSKSYIMSPGELAVFSAENGQIHAESIRTELYTSWRNLELVFDETPLYQIADRIEYTYGVEVVIRNQELRNMRFTGTAPNENLSVLLEGLRILLDVPITEEPQTVTIG
jgi:transmembrane sensor